MLIVGLLALVGSITRLTGHSGHNSSLPLGIIGLILAAAWVVFGIRLKTMLVNHRGLLLALFGVSVARGAWLAVTGVVDGEGTAIFAGAFVAAIALYLCFNAARLSRELRAAPTAAAPDTHGTPVTPGTPSVQRS